MSLIKRKPRPIATRDKDPSQLRDDRLFIVACDDTYAPQQYFGFFRFPRVQIHVVPTLDGTSSAEAVLARLSSFTYEEDDERWMLLDTDHVTEETHLKNFVGALREAEKKGIRVALSKPCFEFWLLLHHEEPPILTPLQDAKAVEGALRQRLGEYNKCNLKKEHYPLPALVQAITRAQRLDVGGDIPKANTSRVYLLWKAIVEKSLPAQVPREMRDIFLR